MTTNTVAVHGASGTQGSALANRLRAAGYQIRPLTSRSIDLTDIESLVHAYRHADAVVVQLPLVFDPVALSYAETVLAALEKASVRRAMLNTGGPLPSEPVGVPYVDARWLLADRLPEAVESAWIFGPGGPYLENLLQPWSMRRVRERGELVYPLPGTLALPWVTLDDIGDAMAAALSGVWETRVNLLSGPQPIAGNMIAEAVAAAADRQVRWVQATPDEYQPLLATVIGADAAANVIAHAAALTVAPAEMVRPGPTTIKQWALRHDWAGRG